MTNAWTPKDTTTHQDHVIAHVLGATFLGYFVFDEVLYILLDIGFVWMIFLDGEMNLLPHPVAISELEIAGEAKEQVKADVELLLSDEASDEGLLLLKRPGDGSDSKTCRIEGVEFFADGEQRRWLVTGEEMKVAIETSLVTAEVKIYEC